VVRSSFHLADALAGLTIGVLTAGLVIWWRRPPATAVALAAVAAAVAMAAVVGRGLVDTLTLGMTAAALAAALVAGVGWFRLARCLEPVWIAALVLITQVGVWAAVPDTEAAVAVLAASVPFAVLATIAPRLPAGTRRFGTTSLLPWVGLALVVALAAAWGAAARPSVEPGALACFGLALVAPWTIPRAYSGQLPGGPVVVHAVAVGAAARWATRSATASGGALRSLAVLALLACMLAVSLRLAARAPRQPSDPPEHPG